MYRKTISLIALLFLGIQQIFAGSFSDVMSTEWINDKYVLYAMYIAIGLLLILVLMLYRVAMHLSRFTQKEFAEDEEEAKSYRFWERLFQVRSITTDKDMLLDHDYDGIKELDNPAPPWFMYLFYGTILFAVVYFVRFQVTGAGPTQVEEYITELDNAEKARQAKQASGGEEVMNINEDNVELATDENDLRLGKITFVSKCQICHGEGGRGLSGPNLTDDYWRHGGGIKNVFKTIKYGVLDKGMASWQGSLTPKQIRDVASYILSLKPVTEAEGGLPPYGELYVPEDAPAEAATDSTADASADAMATDSASAEG